VAAAGVDDHVVVLLEDDVERLVVEEQQDARGARGRAAGARHAGRVHDVEQRLHDRVVGGVLRRRQREGALARAVERVVAARRDDPALNGSPFQPPASPRPAPVAHVPVQRAEAHVERAPLTRYPRREDVAGCTKQSTRSVQVKNER